jgi:hypothetical protein
MDEIRGNILIRNDALDFNPREAKSALKKASYKFKKDFRKTQEIY